MPSRLLTLGRSIRSLLNNAALATWAQAALIGIGFGFTIIQIRATDHNNAVNLSAQFVTKYIDLDIYKQVGQYSITQYNAVQKAKTKIDGYDPAKDPGFLQLFKVAHPLIAEAIDNDGKEIHNIAKIEMFFEVTAQCVRLSACNNSAISGTISKTMLIFFNAVCPYTEKLGDSWGTLFFPETLTYLYFRQRITHQDKYLCKRFLSRIDPANQMIAGD